MRKNYWLFIPIFFLCLIFGVGVGHAEQNIFGLDAANTYDVYILNDENSRLFVIRSVIVVEMREILGEPFILIRSDSFASKMNEGLIRFSSIQAVIPSKRSFKVEGATQFIQ